MPTISIFIRTKDLPRWQALDNKSQWLHDNLPGAQQTPAQPLTSVSGPSPFPTKDLWMYDGLDLHNYFYNISKDLVFEVGDDAPYELADAEMVSRLKQLGRVAKY